MGKKIDKNRQQDLKAIIDICLRTLHDQNEIDSVGIVFYDDGKLRVYGRKAKRSNARDLFVVQLSPKSDEDEIGKATIIDITWLGKRVAGLNGLLNKKDFILIDPEDFEIVKAKCDDKGQITLTDKMS
ncbi:MAG: hypothetical protein EOM74_04670 [Methanomicrobia archaeon]|nr:hypothetical protein [Methanomicrobia archaeon]